jgi:hypothetical protein
MASIWEVPKVIASPQDNGYECVYAADNQRIVSLAVRSSGEFEAERARFEDRGFLLPPLEPVDRFDGTANVDPRYNSLNVIAGDLVVSVELLGTEPWDPTEQLALEKRRGQLSAGSRSPSRLARPAVRGDAGKRACPQAVDSSNSCKSS